MSKVSLFALRTDSCLPLSKAKTLIAPERYAQIRSAHKDFPNPSLFGELLLCWAVRTFQPEGISIPPLRSIASHGKPYFPSNLNFQFSLSHSGCWVVLAISEKPVGVDIERIAKPRPKIVSRYFHPEEQKHFSALPAVMQTDAFYKFWVLKESVLKALGIGLRLPLDSFTISLDTTPHVIGVAAESTLFLPSFADPNYCLGVCVLSETCAPTSCQILSLSDVLNTK